ncbi:MAG: pyridoxal phosphate-dependent aminotransferase [Clostridia bacterium]|nr:pyridoxal phosphate-dependent aminotransferase [Clostridia bacterium]
MFNQKNVALGETRSSIRELFEYGRKRKAEIGEDNVFDFSLGNPSVPAPKEVNECIKEIVDNTDPVLLHGYTSAQGDFSVRDFVAKSINRRFGTGLDADCVYMTCGAAASLTITLGALLTPGDEVVVPAPYFPEYKIFTESSGGMFVSVQTIEGTFGLDLSAIEKALTPKTRAVLINSPNNPSGAVYDEKSIKDLCALLKAHSEKFSPVYLISDEPYREVVYDGAEVPYIMNHYDRSIVCYSYSKCLSLPGERIGYIAVNSEAEEKGKLYAGICGAGRALGFVCAPSLFQRLIVKTDGLVSDISIYKANRDRLSSRLTELGFEVARAGGAFYLFVKSPEPDAKKFAERAKSHEILIVPGDDFGKEGYVRISYCVSPEMIERSLPAFESLAKEYR